MHCSEKRESGDVWEEVPSTRQGVREVAIIANTSSWTSSLQNCEKLDVCCWRYWPAAFSQDGPSRPVLLHYMETHGSRQCLIPCCGEDQRLITLGKSIVRRQGMMVLLHKLAHLLFALSHPAHRTWRGCKEKADGMWLHISPHQPWKLYLCLCWVRGEGDLESPWEESFTNISKRWMRLRNCLRMETDGVRTKIPLSGSATQ